MIPAAGDGRFGYPAAEWIQCDEILIRSIDRLRRQQSERGDWGDRPKDTAQVLQTLIEIGLPLDRPEIQRAADRLVERLTPLAERPARKLSPVELDDALAAMTALAGLFPAIVRGSSSAVTYDSVLTSFRCDDTARALGRARRFDHIASVCRKMQASLLTLQWRRGGWPVRSRKEPRRLLEKIPLLGGANRSGRIRLDLTGRALEALGRWGFRGSDENIQRAIAALRTAARPEGNWNGDESTSCLCATYHLLIGLQMVGFPADDPIVQAAADWIESGVDAHGRWVASPAEPDSVQAARVLLVLVACGRDSQSAAHRVAGFLLMGFSADPWDTEPKEEETAMHHYFDRICLPLRALAAWQNRAG